MESASNESRAFAITLRVTPEHIDRLAHVNNSIYLRWIEEAVHAHWAALATPQEFAAYEWIAVRHEIDYRSPARLDDVLRVETALVSVRRVRAWYVSTVTRGTNVLAEARSCWCCIDATSHRLTPVPAATVARFLPDRGD